MPGHEAAVANPTPVRYSVAMLSTWVEASDCPELVEKSFDISGRGRREVGTPGAEREQRTCDGVGWAPGICTDI